MRSTEVGNREKAATTEFRKLVPFDRSGGGFFEAGKKKKQISALLSFHGVIDHCFREVVLALRDNLEKRIC
ncbi:unnamed protein product [Caenorhabditis auriculariae]|uniref:Uncharacterized protein n=1 Tax=Caenorhabditis auriculariae TaxID=2777116 RepID=A0A8S1GWZ4_9PELO|nr:unnamed protein product [Caenorhabditis auriculariae]